MKTTIAQQLKIKDFPFFIKDKYGNEIYYEDSIGLWSKWSKSEYDAYGNEIYRETSDGVVFDRRPKQVEPTLQEIADTWVPRYVSEELERELATVTAQRDRLAEALDRVMKHFRQIAGDCVQDKQRDEELLDAENAEQALQSLTPNV
jgi:hypothetical protein